MNEDNTFQPILVTVKAHSEKASRRTKNRTGEAMWLLDVSHPDCMGGKKCGRFEAKKSSSQMVMNGRSMSSEVWHGWLPLDEIIIKKDGKFLDLA
jgi:hypothetical protein